MIQNLELNYSKWGLGGGSRERERKRSEREDKERVGERAGEEMIGDIFQGQRKYAGHLLL